MTDDALTNSQAEFAALQADAAAAMPTPECATNGCIEPGAWISIPEGNALGSDAPRRCTGCCDAIAAHDIPVGGLHGKMQIRPWSKIPRDYRSTDEHGVRHTLAMTERGTSLVPWYGPAN